MPGWALLLGTLVYNYSRHRRGLPTICATTRRALPRPVSATALAGGYLYLAIHVWRGYPHDHTPSRDPASTTS